MLAGTLFSTLGKGQLPGSQADRAGHESPGEDCGRPHQTVGVNRRFPIWLRPRQRHNRHNLCCQAAAREVSSCQQETLHGFRRPGEGFWSSISDGHLVGAEKTWCWGMDCASGAEDVCKCAEPCPCWWGVQWRVWSEGRCSPGLSTQPASRHHCAWSLITRVPLWGPLAGPQCRWPCYHRWIARGMCQEALDLKRSNGKERTVYKCRKDEGHDLRYGPGPPAELRWVSMRRLSHCSGQQQHLLQRLQVLGAQEIQRPQALDKGPWLRMYTVPGNCTSLRRQTIERSPSRTWQAGGGSFLLLPRRHAFSSRWLWTFNHDMCENRLEEVQGAATSSLFTPPLSRHVAVYTAIVCAAQCSMPVRLCHGQNQTSNVCSGMTGQWSDRSAMSGRKTLSPPGPLSSLRGLALRIWTSFWRREGSAGIDMWNAPMVQSRQPFTYRLRESVGLGGPRWHGSSWQRGIGDSGSPRLTTLIEICWDLVWDLPCVQQASYLEGDPLMWMLSLYLHVNQKSDYDDMIISQ